MILKILSRPSRPVITMVLLFAGLLAAPSELPAEPVVYIAPESFLWREFVDGERAVKESGLLFSGGIAYPVKLEDRVTFVPRAELFGGSVDYEGQACDPFGNCDPATTTVDYLGLKLEGDLYRDVLSSPKSFLEPFGGLGFRIWSRDLQSGTSAGGEAATGYAEDWMMLYMRAGARGGILLSGKKELYLQAGVILPAYVENTAYVSDIGQGPDITMRPGRQVSFFGEAGIQAHRFTATLFYDSLRFPQSPVETNGFVAAYQPRSTMDLYGVKAGWRF